MFTYLVFVYYVRKSKCKNSFEKACVPSWTGEIFVKKPLKDSITWAYAIENSNQNLVTATFNWKWTQDQLRYILSKKSFETESKEIIHEMEKDW